MTTSKRTPGEFREQFGLIQRTKNNAVIAVFAHEGARKDIYNAALCASALTVANRLDAAGYDGEACIAALPELLDCIKRVLDDYNDGEPEVCRPPSEHSPGYWTPCAAMVRSPIIGQLRAALSRCKGEGK